jgi:hypothetical protein
MTYDIENMKVISSRNYLNNNISIQSLYDLFVYLNVNS